MYGEKVFHQIQVCVAELSVDPNNVYIYAKSDLNAKKP